MKIAINPLTTLTQRAENRALVHFNPGAQDLVHARKRHLAESILAGAPATAEFTQAAKIEGMTPTDLSRLIVSKPDNLMTLENARRAVVVKLRAAKTSAELNQILTDAGISLKNLTSDVMKG